MSVAPKLSGMFNKLVEEALFVAGGLERGQADAPLTALFERLKTDFEDDHFTAVLIGLTPETRTRALEWMYGSEYSVVSVSIVEKLGLVEIRLSEHGFTLEHGGGEVTRFDRLDAFLSAIADTDSLTHPRTLDWVKPVRLGLRPSSSVRGITLLLPERAELILEHPPLMSRLVTQSNLAIFAAPIGHELQPQEKQTLEQLGAFMDGILPLLVVDELAGDAAIPEIGWWQRYKAAALQLPPKLLTTRIQAELPQILVSEDEGTRNGLFVTQQARRLVDAAEALRDAYDQRLRLLGTRTRREERKTRQTEGSGSDIQSRRQLWKELQQSINEKLPTIEKQLVEVQRKSKGSDGDLVRQINQFLISLTDSDLSKEPGHSVIKLTVSDRFLEDLRRCAREGVRKQYKYEVEWLMQELDTLRQSTINQLQALADEAVTLPPLELDQRAIWNGVQDMFDVQLRYRGEMPKRGFWDRLKEGRQGAMSFMMIVGIGAMAFGSNLRQNPIFGVALLAIFFGTIMYTFSRWRKDDAERIDKELDRVRDGVSSEVQRLISDVQREIQAKFSEHLQSVRKQCSQAIEQAMELDVSRRQTSTEHQRVTSRDRLRTVDQHRQELEGLRSSITRLEKGCSDFLQQCLRQLRESA